MDYQFIEGLPKVELHCHLDGSVPVETLIRLADKDGLAFDPEAVIAPEKCLDLADYLTCFDAILPLLQTAENLEIATVAVIESLAAENVRYAELRFAPLLHQEQGLTTAAVIQAVCAGVTAAAKQYETEVRLIISAMRHHSPEQNAQLLEAVQALDHPYVLACDAAGDEASFDNQVVADYITGAKAAGLQISLHSGECGCAHNVYEAIRLGADRVGHGVAIKDDPAVLAETVRSGTVLELCPVSNLQTNAIRSWADYPLPLFLEKGVRCTINTDNRTVSQTSLTREFMTLAAECGLTRDQLRTLSVNAVAASFTDKTTKAELLAGLADYFDREE